VFRWAIVIGFYVGAALAFVIATNADQQNGDIPLYIVPVSALAVGWVTGSAGWRGLRLWILLPWIVVPLALPFGDANKATGGDDLLPVALLAVFPAVIAMLFMLLGAGARGLHDRHHHNSAAY
jgi:hypothetical protein